MSSLGTLVSTELADLCSSRDVYVNGTGPLTFILSTDTTNTCLSLDLAKKLNLKLESHGTGIRLGGEVRVYRTRVNRLRIGSLELRDVELLVVDLSHLSKKFGFDVHGVIGSDILIAHRAVIDLGEMVVRFRRPECQR